MNGGGSAPSSFAMAASSLHPSYVIWSPNTTSSNWPPPFSLFSAASFPSWLFDMAIFERNGLRN